MIQAIPFHTSQIQYITYLIRVLTLAAWDAWVEGTVSEGMSTRLIRHTLYMFLSIKQGKLLLTRFIILLYYWTAEKHEIKHVIYQNSQCITNSILSMSLMLLAHC